MAEPKQPLAPTFESLLTDSATKPINLREEMESLGLIGPHIKAEDLVDQTFVVFAAKRCLSKKYPDSPYYFCNCTDKEKSETFSTTLGGAAVVEMLDKYIAAGVNKPFEVTLRFIEEGSHDGYYVIE